MEVIIDVFLIFIEVILEDFGCIGFLPIDILSGIGNRQCVRFEIIANECARIIAVKGRSDYQLVRQKAGNDAIIEGCDSLFRFAEIVNKDRGGIVFRYRLNTDIGVVEIGSDGGMYKILFSPCAIDAIRSTVADLGIGDYCVCVEQNQAI